MLKAGGCEIVLEMLCIGTLYIIFFTAIVQTVLTDLIRSNNSTSNESAINITHKPLDGTLENWIKQEGINTRRKKSKKHRSTSSSSDDWRESETGESIDLSTSISSSTSDEKKRPSKTRPVSTEERKGWRKWHRKCAPCPKDMAKKWKDQSINWICGAYQRARRSFKSLCMMHYRNCQDGTMFIKIHNHRCANDTGKLAQPYGDHFFYNYPASLSGDSSSSKSKSSSESSSLVSTEEDYIEDYHRD